MEQAQVIRLGEGDKVSFMHQNYLTVIPGPAIVVVITEEKTANEAAGEAEQLCTNPYFKA